MTVNMKFFVRLARIIDASIKRRSNVDLIGVIATGKKKLYFKQQNKKHLHLSFLLLFCFVRCVYIVEVYKSRK